MNNNHVSVEQFQCPVCLQIHSHGAGILLATKYNHSGDPVHPLERGTLTGRQFCKEHQQQHDDGFVFLIAVEPNDPTAKRPNVTDVKYLGSHCAIQKSVAEELLTVPVEPIMFCGMDAIELIASMVQDPED